MSLANEVEQSEFGADHISTALPRQFDYSYDAFADSQGLSSTDGVVAARYAIKCDVWSCLELLIMTFTEPAPVTRVTLFGSVFSHSYIDVQLARQTLCHYSCSFIAL